MFTNETKIIQNVFRVTNRSFNYRATAVPFINPFHIFHVVSLELVNITYYYLLEVPYFLTINKLWIHKILVN